jgi:predicted membrane channel-forming protein YqfA (hemolysin III family)
MVVRPVCYSLEETIMEPSDQPSGRKLAAIALILLLILVWAGLVATLSPWVGRMPILVQALFYLFMGIAWIAPLRPLIRWSQTGSFRNSGQGER